MFPDRLRQRGGGQARPGERAGGTGIHRMLGVRRARLRRLRPGHRSLPKETRKPSNPDTRA
ncbi:Hypothetical protein AA314_07372 [Archangium gephyra]|uniref:Uncharacterized protein n=1 Tax=Archangium gephyra TaxID=48 RepID=A0AAC8TIM5_9BACT|nr:Hypothetical protein AA314_07372 [Archangium gephyra]